MHFARVLFGALLASLGRAGAQGAPVGDKSHILDKNNFDSKTSSGTWVIKHYSPSCHHCQSFQPKWDQVVTQQAIPLSAQDVHFGEIDCLENQELCTQNKVFAWPTVGVFRAGKRLDGLEGDKSEKELSEFIKRSVSEADAVPQAYDANSIILNQSNFTETTKRGTWIVKHYSPVCHHCRQMAPEWIKLTDELAKQMAGNQILFGEVDCPANKKVCEENHVDGYPTVNLYVNGRYIEEMSVRYTYDAMKGYVLKLPERIKRGNFAPPPASQASSGQADTSPGSSSDDVTDDKRGAEEYNLSGEVVTLTKENFADKTSLGPWFVKFYAPWCTHCQHLAPIWTQLGEASKGKVNIGKINCDEASALCSKYNVQGYPTLKLLWEGETTDFKGTRDLSSLSTFVDNVMAQPNLVQSTADLQRAQKASDVVYLFAYDKADTSAKTKAALTHVKANAQKMFLSRQLNIVSDTALARQVLPAGDIALPTLVALKDGKTVSFGGSLTNDDQIHEWFYAERFPLLPELSRENSDALFYDSDYLVLVILDTERGEDYVDHYRSSAREAAMEYSKAYGAAGNSKSKGTVRFAWVNGNKWASYVDRVFRIRHDNWPAIVIARPSEDQFFTTDVRGAPIEPSKMGVFLAVRAVLEGKLKAQSTNSIITRGAHGLAWAVKSVWGLLFGSALRVLLTLAGLGGIAYYLHKRGQHARAEAHGLVKGD
ncbi:hypothetical protein GGI18_000770 [Coemansia linderi]|uniref:Uncharacterized protein n=1 Tax=Coemansia linderi TaxID=2663919 RepID=A0ACC1KN46_9FUNG|nr:hypothetical protein GGI18_000770 [Coemansia linderi]